MSGGCIKHVNDTVDNGADKEMKTCYYVEKHNRYGWYLPDATSCMAYNCIMAVVKEHAVLTHDLCMMVSDGSISDKECCSIDRFDNVCGEETDLETIQTLAMRLEVELVKK